MDRRTPSLDQVGTASSTAKLRVHSSATTGLYQTRVITTIIATQPHSHPGHPTGNHLYAYPLVSTAMVMVIMGMGMDTATGMTTTIIKETKGIRRPTKSKRKQTKRPRRTKRRKTRPTSVGSLTKSSKSL